MLAVASFSAEYDQPAACSGDQIRLAIPPRREPNVYGSGRRLNWPAIAIVAAIHAALLVALIMFDVISIVPKAKPTEVTLIPLSISKPSPAAKQQPTVKPVETPPQIVAPPPIVQPLVLTPPPIQVTPTPPPPAPTAAPPAVVAEAAPAAPVRSPDGTARTLGNPAPKYPMQARRAHQEGTVRLRVVITAAGRVKDIIIARSSGFNSLDDAALDCVRNWRFLPGLQAGEPVEAIGYLNIPFRLAAA